MSFFDIFRRFFVGTNESVPRSDSQFRNDFRHPIWDDNEDDSSDNDLRNPDPFFSFNVYTDPLEMHRFFEQQMNEMLKNFQMLEPFQDIGSFFGSGFNRSSEIEQSPSEYFQQLPAIEDSKESSQNLRDQLLKPEFKSKKSDKVDTVLDGKFDADDIGKALDRKDNFVPIWSADGSDRSLLLPSRESQTLPSRDLFSFSGRSFVSRIVTLPDGTIEREEVVKDSNGTERKTVTRSVGGHEYSVTTVKDASGAEQRTENYKNIDPEKIEDFNQVWDSHHSKWRFWWNSRNPFF